VHAEKRGAIVWYASGQMNPPNWLVLHVCYGISESYGRLGDAYTLRVAMTLVSPSLNGRMSFNVSSIYWRVQAPYQPNC